MSDRSSNQNVGHGHIFPRPDGVKSRCGGPAICHVCAHDLARKTAEQPSSKQGLPEPRYDNRLETMTLSVEQWQEVQKCIDRLQQQIEEMKPKLVAAEQLAVRQGNEIRKLRSGERA